MNAKSYLLTLVALSATWTATGFADHQKVVKFAKTPSPKRCTLLENVAKLVENQGPGTEAEFYHYLVVKEDTTGKTPDKYASTSKSKAGDGGSLVLFPTLKQAYLVSSTDTVQVTYPSGTISVGKELKLAPASQ